MKSKLRLALVLIFIGSLISSPLAPTARAEDTATCDIQWQTMPVPNVGSLSSLSVRTKNDVWALGTDGVLHWNGQTWRTIPRPDRNHVFYEIRSITALSSARALSVGTRYLSGNDYDGLVEVWDGSKWQETILDPEGGAELVNVVGIADDDIWAMGDYNGYEEDLQPLIMHRDETDWSVEQVPSVPNFGTIGDLVEISPSDVWAIGVVAKVVPPTEPFRPLLVHWDGFAWTRVDAPAPTNPSFNVRPATITAVASNDVWVFGNQDPDSSALTLHWDGASWRYEDAATGTHRVFEGSTTIGSDIWAVGTKGKSQNKPLLRHWNGTDWSDGTIMDSGSPLRHSRLHDIAGKQGVLYAVGAKNPGTSSSSLVARGALPIPFKIKPLAPVDGAVLNTRTVTFEWTSRLCAKRYELTVRRDSINGSIVIQEKNLKTAEFNTKLERGVAYFWQVVGCNSGGCSEPSNWQSFRVE